MVELFDNPSSFGDVKWWIGTVAPRSTWASGGNYDNDKEVGNQQNKGGLDIYYNRVKVRVVGYHDQIRDPYDLPWANIVASPMMAAGYGFMDKNHMLRGGESVIGFWGDGEDEQKPFIIGVFYRGKLAEDSAPVASGLDIPASHEATLNQTPTGQTASTNVGTGDQTPEVRYSTSQGYDEVTGRKTKDKPTRYPVLNQESAQKGSPPKGVSQAALVQADLLDVATEKPTCKRDNAIGAITGFLSDFAKLLRTAQSYANFYVNGVTGVLQNLQSEINIIAKKITSIMTGLANGVRDWIFAQIGEKISKFIFSILPEELKPAFGESLKEIMDTIYCIFENLIKAILQTVTEFLISLIGKFINAPLCAAEQFVGALLNSLSNGISSAISPILDTLTQTLGGALGNVNEIIDKALNYVGLIYSFIGCDQFKCPLPSRYDNKLGPSQKERDNANKIFKGISLLKIPTAYDENGNPKQTLGGFLDEANENVDSIFKLTPKQQQTAEEVASLVGECETQVLRCGPPIIEIFGGDGFGGFANAVVSNLGNIIGADVIEKGTGYTPQKPPYVTFYDACGNGEGARGRAIIGDDGGIAYIVIDNPGYGYLNNYGDTITTSGTIPGTTSGTTPGVTDGATETIPQLDDVIVTNPGFGYNPDDQFNIPGIKPVVVGGRVIDVEVIDPGIFDNLPDIELNSETGIGAAFQPVLKFTKVDELSRPLDPTKIVQVINCVSR